jgi:N-glycosylase/DNA lyase
VEAFWSPWQDVVLPEALSPRVLEEILDGGQAFRWHLQAGRTWMGVWAGHAAELRLNAAATLQARSPVASGTAGGAAVRSYLDAGRSARTLADALPWRSDAHLARCLEAFPGLRLLRQPFGETLLCFLCSAAKQVLQIKQMAACMAERHGPPLFPGTAAAARHAAFFHRLPTWAELAKLPEAALRDCKLGFRARHVHQTARFLTAHPGWLEMVEAAPYAEAKALLCELPGVGEKIADCVLLFGAGRLEAFPVDVWIIKAMSRRYGLEGWKPAQVAHFGRAHFGPLAGLAQQYLFAWERDEKKRGLASPGML